MQIKEVVAHGVHHGAMGSLTTAHIRLHHRVDPRGMTPGFPTTEEIDDDVHIERLIA